MMLRHPPCRIGMSIDHAHELESAMRLHGWQMAVGGYPAQSDDRGAQPHAHCFCPITSTHPLCDSFAGTSALSPMPRALPSTPAIERGMREPAWRIPSER